MTSLDAAAERIKSEPPVQCKTELWENAMENGSRAISQLDMEIDFDIL